MLLFIFIREEYLTEEANFNTSHVTVYQKDWTAKVADSTISIHLMLLFISMSCRIAIRLPYFNTSHVTVYHIVDVVLYTRNFYFNTSHVTVYQYNCVSVHSITKFQYISCYCLSFSRPLSLFVTAISIHLMLLFIEGAEFVAQGTNGFQYISCYCLSVFYDLRHFNYL